MAGSPPFSHFRFSIGGLLGGTIATIPLLLLLVWSLRTRWGPIARLVELVDQRIAPLFAGCSPAQLACIALFAGLGEEALFRGVLQAGLAEHLPVGVAILVAGAVFGLIHFLTPTYAALATLVGWYLGALFVLFDNLLMPVTTHAVYDFVALSVVAHLRPSGRSASA